MSIASRLADNDPDFENATVPGLTSVFDGSPENLQYLSKISQKSTHRAWATEYRWARVVYQFPQQAGVSPGWLAGPTWAPCPSRRACSTCRSPCCCNRLHSFRIYIFELIFGNSSSFYDNEINCRTWTRNQNRTNWLVINHHCEWLNFADIVSVVANDARQGRLSDLVHLLFAHRRRVEKVLVPETIATTELREIYDSDLKRKINLLELFSKQTGECFSNNCASEWFFGETKYEQIDVINVTGKFIWFFLKFQKLTHKPFSDVQQWCYQKQDCSNPPTPSVRGNPHCSLHSTYAGSPWSRPIWTIIAAMSTPGSEKEMMLG